MQRVLRQSESAVAYANCGRPRRQIDAALPAMAAGKGVWVCVTSSYTARSWETLARLVEKHIIISTQIRLDNASFSLIDGCIIADTKGGREREGGREGEKELHV